MAILRHTHSLSAPRSLSAAACLLLISLHLPTALAKDDVVTVTVAPAIPSNAPQYINDTTFTSVILNSTNFFRTEHNASWISWNETLASFADEYLDLDADCKFAHSGGPYGENIGMGYPEASGCVDAWGNEREIYDYDDPRFTEQTGHFTQLVWKNTTTVGCGKKLCGTRGWFLVCEYWPRGNVVGEFGGQVGRQINGTGANGSGSSSHDHDNGSPRISASSPLPLSVLAFLVVNLVVLS